MPVTKSAKKAAKQSAKKRAVNAQYKTDMKVAVKIFEKKIAKGEKLKQEDLAAVYSKIAKAKKKNILHKKTAARRMAKMAKMYNVANAS